MPALPLTSAARRLEPAAKRFGHDGAGEPEARIPAACRLVQDRAAPSTPCCRTPSRRPASRRPPAAITARRWPMRRGSSGVTARIFVPGDREPRRRSRVIRSPRSRGGDRRRALCGCARTPAKHMAESGALRSHPFAAARARSGPGHGRGSNGNRTARARHGAGGGRRRRADRGIASWWAGRVKVVGVEPEGSRALHAALEAGRPVDVDGGFRRGGFARRAQRRRARLCRSCTRGGGSRGARRRMRRSAMRSGRCGATGASPPSRAARRHWPR